MRYFLLSILLLSCNKISLEAKMKPKPKPKPTQLHEAVLPGNEDRLKVLLADPDVDVNAKGCGETPLHWICRRGYIEAARLLLVNKNVDINAIDEDGRPPLHIVFSCDKLTPQKRKLIKLILNDSRLDINAKDYFDQTLLHLACRKGWLEIIKLLLMHKEIKLDIKDSLGRIPLDRAQMIEDKAILEKMENLFKNRK